MKAKKISKKYPKIPPKSDIHKFKWPSFFDVEKANYLAKRVFSAAKNKFEQQVFMSIFRRHYDEAAELEILYNELSGLFAGDKNAIKYFQGILNQATNRKYTSGKKIRIDQQHKVLIQPRSSGAFPCPGHSFFINPSRIILIIDGVFFLTRGNRFLFPSYINTLVNLLHSTRHLERLYRLAVEGISDNGRDRLAEHMKMLNKNIPPDLLIFDNRMGIPNPDGSWPPTDFPPIGPPDYIWPPDGILPPDDILPPDPCEMLQEACLEVVFSEALDNSFTGFVFEPSGVSYADGIEYIQPNHCCAGEIITIYGSGFGSSQPEDVFVLINTKFVEVVKWSDTEIEIRIPEGTTRGCVGFFRRYSRYVRRNNLKTRKQRNSRLIEFCIGVDFPDFGIRQYIPPVPCVNGNNYFRGTVPEVDYFHINGNSSLPVDTSSNLVLSWSVHFPDATGPFMVEEDGTITPVNPPHVYIKRISTSGPNIDGDYPAVGTINIGLFDGPQGAVARYQIGAMNSCGTVNKTAEAVFGEKPNLQITGIEVIQAIQHYDVSNMSASDNNSVQFVANKRTVVRVYIESGLTTSPYLQPNVTGNLDLLTPSGGIITEIRGIKPFNDNEVVTARPVGQIDRHDLCHSLNFELPIGSLSGSAEIIVNAWVKGHEDEILQWTAHASTNIYFNQSAERILVRILVRDGNLNIAAPTVAQYNTSVQGARTRFPIQENGFIIHIAAGYETITSNHNLGTDAGWENLLDDIDDIADEFEDWNQIWTALVPNDTSYSLNGISMEGDEYPRLAAQAELQATFAHELGHTRGVGHAVSTACGRSPLNIDANLPGGTEDIGMDVRGRQLIPESTSELMSYCTPNWTGFTSCGSAYPTATYQDRWPSIVLWNKLFNEL